MRNTFLLIILCILYLQINNIFVHFHTGSAWVSEGPGRNYFLEPNNNFKLYFGVTQYRGPGTIIRQGPRQESRPSGPGQADPVFISYSSFCVNDKLLYCKNTKTYIGIWILVFILLKYCNFAIVSFLVMIENLRENILLWKLTNNLIEIWKLKNLNLAIK
jgi:hypothetical protein